MEKTTVKTESRFRRRTKRLFMNNDESKRHYSVQFFFLTFFWSIPLTRFVLLVPFATYSDGDYSHVNRDFYITCFGSFIVFHVVILIFFGIYGHDFITLNKITRKFNVVFCTIMFCIANCILPSLFFEASNIIMAASKMCGSNAFNSSLFNHSKAISFLTANYMPWYGRLVSLVLIFLFGTVLNIYCFYQGNRLPYKHLTLYSDKVKKEVKFVHISDVHIGSRFKQHSINIVEKILPVEPDFVVITGDLVDSPNVEVDELMPFKDLTDKVPTYMVMGNHDYICGLEMVRYMASESGIQLVENAVIDRKDLDMAIIGTNDADCAEEYVETAKRLMKQTKKGIYNIILQHRPFGYNDLCRLGGYDLMLAGHTHVGQLWPWHVVTYLIFHKPYGLYKIKKDNKEMHLYTHPGTGAWACYMRSAGKNHITVFHIKPASELTENHVSIEMGSSISHPEELEE